MFLKSANTYFFIMTITVSSFSYAMHGYDLESPRLITPPQHSELSDSNKFEQPNYGSTNHGTASITHFKHGFYIRTSNTYASGYMLYCPRFNNLVAPCLNYIYAHRSGLSRITIVSLLLVATAAFGVGVYYFLRQNGETGNQTSPLYNPTQNQKKNLRLWRWAIVDSHKNSFIKGKLELVQFPKKSFMEIAASYASYQTLPLSFSTLCLASDEIEWPYCLHAVHEAAIHSPQKMLSLEFYLRNLDLTSNNTRLQLPISWSRWFSNTDGAKEHFCLQNRQVFPCQNPTDDANGR